YNTHIKSLKNDSNKVIIHSDFIKKDRERIMGIITNSFGKGGAKDKIVFSAPILQAALDISFDNLSKTSESPENDIQVIGRVNRWGENDQANINLIYWDK